MKNRLSHETIMKGLAWAYGKAIDPNVRGLDSAEKLALDYMGKGKTPEDDARSLIRWQTSKSATYGFVSGLGGVLTMPVTVPANIASVMFIQTRMVAAIAHMGGHDIRNDKVQSLVYICLAGNAGKDILKETGIMAGRNLATQTIKSISTKVITDINKKVGFRLLTKFGGKGLINLGKAVPLVGGVIGGTLDGLSTKIIGNVAIRTFIR